jgi:hypothetical protein
LTPTAKILNPAIQSEYKKLRETFSHDSYYAIQILLRRLDVISMFFWNSEHLTEEQVNESREFFNFGWAPLLKLFLNDHNFDTPHQFIQTKKQDYDWADSVLLYSGRLAFCRQLLDYEKANLLNFRKTNENEFEIKYLHEQIGHAYFERKSVDFYREQIVEKIIKEKKTKNHLTDSEIKSKLREVIQNPYGKFISYATTEEIDEYYNEKGHHHILRTQSYDDFDTKDTFGSIEYWKYVDLIEIICGVALMHKDACVELTKMNSEVDMHNVLSYMYFKDSTIKIYSNHLGVSEDEIEQIISCITLHKDNYQYYLDNPAPAPPMYLQVSENQLIRSIAGCLGNPFRFLNAELKRKYKRDYDVAVNNRENRFRKELFLFFPHERIIKIPREINLSFNGMKTDIDAILYDSETKTLGLFQLKWQDPFAHSMKERYSRISNMFPKANEWIEKMKFWLSNNDKKTVLNSLQITKHFPKAREIEEICVFVIARNDIHFTGIKTDERVAWGSWHQIIESQARVETKFDDPIREMFVKLKTFTPENRMTREEVPTRQKFEANIGDYKVWYNEER